MIRSALAALKWNYLGVAARTASGFIIGIVLARLLGPRPFGQVAVAWLVIGLGNLLADCGFGAALVQRRELSQEDIRFVFTAQLGLGILLAIVVVMAADPVAWLFHQPEVAPVVRALAGVFALQALGLTAQNLLKRDLAFRRLQTAQVASYLAGYVALGIPMAYRGYGVWSLVAAQLTQTFLNSALLYLAARHPIRPKIFHRHRALTSFGGKVIGANVVNWVIGNCDTAIVGNAFGATSLGLYNRSAALTLKPTNAVVAGLQSVLFPVYARAQAKPDSLRRGFLTSIAALAIGIFPLFVTVAVIPRAIIEGLYGERWSAAIPLLIPIALARPFHASMALAGPLLWGVGKVERELRVQIPVLLITIPALLLASRLSLLAVAWTILGIMVLEAFLLSRPALQEVRMDWQDVGRVTRGPILLSAALAAAVWTADRTCFAAMQAPLRLAADAGTATALAFLLLRVFPKLFLCDELMYLVRQDSVPAWVKSWLARGLDSGVEAPAVADLRARSRATP